MTKKITITITTQVEDEQPETLTIAGNLESVPHKLKMLAKKMQADYQFLKISEPAKYFKL